jgi:hypothetical protein
VTPDSNEGGAGGAPREAQGEGTELDAVIREKLGAMSNAV